MDESAPPALEKPSKTPSWVMLGFILGALFVWSLQRSPEAPLPAPVIADDKPPVPVGPLPAPRLMAIEAVFADWGNYAIWENDITEVALWTPESKKYSDYYEVIRSGGNLYFRSIDHLTRPILNHGVKINSPLQFTEPEAHRQEWLRDVRNENLRALTGGHRDDLKPAMRGTKPDEPTPIMPVNALPPAEAAPIAPPPRTGTGDGKP